jgi:hypothetical protein
MGCECGSGRGAAIATGLVVRRCPRDRRTGGRVNGRGQSSALPVSHGRCTPSELTLGGRQPVSGLATSDTLGL